jgi:glycogen(starch) synthase
MARSRFVLMTTDAVGGVWSYSLDLCKELARRKLAVCLAVLGPAPTAEQRARALEIPGLVLRELGGALEWMDDPWVDVERTGEQLRELCAELKPELLHLNGYCHARLDFGIPKLVVAHSCVLSWWRAVEGDAAPPRYERYRQEVQAGLRAADLVVAPTQHMLKTLGDNYGRLRRSQVIPNGAEPEPTSIGIKAPIALCAGRLWDRAKNVETLARAAEGLPWHVYVAGDAGDAPLAGLRPLGKLTREELRGWYGTAGIYVAPCRYEPFGLSILEAALGGCALVLGDIPSLREVWGGAAAYVDPNDAEALSRTLHLLMSRPRARDWLSQRARARALRFGLSQMGEAYWLTYCGLIAERNRVRSRPFAAA